jgi:hypothetical protein
LNANELRQAMAALPDPDTGKRPPHWEYWRWELWKKVTRGDDPINFMDWPCIFHTMLVNHWSMAKEWEYLITNWNARNWPNVIKLHTGWPADEFLSPPNSPSGYSSNMINQAYHIALWENTTGQRIDQLNTIVEFGGGYGAMALLCWRLGFRGQYIIYDLPEFSLLQEWFLSQEGVENVAWNPKGLESYAVTDLLIALYSLGETPIELRDNFLDKIKAKSYLILYSPTWEEYQNSAYFGKLIKENINLTWHNQSTPRQVDYYLVGW